MQTVLSMIRTRITDSISKEDQSYSKQKCYPVGSMGAGVPTPTLQRGKTPPYEYPGYDTKQSDGEVPLMLELWGMWSTPSLPLPPSPLWPEMEAPDRALSMG